MPENVIKENKIITESDNIMVNFKRKSNFQNSETADKPYCKLIKKKKKKLKLTSNAGGISNIEKILSFNNTINYGEVVANSLFLQSEPEIFQSNFLKKKRESIPESLHIKLFSNISFDSKTRYDYSLEEKRIPKADEKNCNQAAISCEALNSSNNYRTKKLDLKKNKKLILKRKKTYDSEKKKIATFIETSASNEEINNSLNLSYADFYETIDKKALIFHLHHPCKFSFHGELKITSIVGKIEILGFVLSESSNFKSIEVFSPALLSPLVVESVAVMQHKTHEEIKKNLDAILLAYNSSTLLNSYKPNDVILLIEPLMSNFGAVIHNYMDLLLFPKELENFSSLSESLKTIQSTFKFDSVLQEGFKKNPAWDTISLKQCTVLCGGKGVGKSTTLKYFINQCITRDEKILVLDFDPGQPEFTPPGFISALVVDKPLLGPNFTHVTEAQLMVYFGDANTSEAPTKYLECVNYIIQWCKNNEELTKIKWLVNTMGYCKGLGVELMISILKLIKPDSVIQIQSSNDQNNYPFLLTHNVVNKKKGFGIFSYDDCLSFSYHKVRSAAEINRKQIRSTLTAAELRDVMTLSYFSTMLNLPDLSFNSIQPFSISFSKIYLGVDFFINPNNILKAFNGNIISLSHFERTSEVVLQSESEKDVYFKIVVKPNVGPSFGLGLVRGVDCEKKKIYILTPLPLKILLKVNCLTLSKISPPSHIFLKQNTVTGPKVYTSVNFDDDAMRNVKRKFKILAGPKMRRTF